MNSPAFIVFDDGSAINLATVTRYFRKDASSEAVAWFSTGDRVVLSHEQADQFEEARQAYLVSDYRTGNVDEARALGMGA